ncbi:pre-mRNA splicing factor component-domain-containing protein [Amylostereum chailletii]|nr:pre-mRNA splicing factor component-domain-containing protein [Amylostereum chailletii]
MVRIIIKGGVWKNTEDEVLKAAIAKYGKNQWARISSLLVRKTPKQCKARWYEWLDPSIKKTEWSKEEDEKLLHLAKLMPTQWRTIAPIVGRTATQCLERYQKLLDEAEAKENEELGLAGPGDSGPGADDVRRLRPGEIDPDPETKPARPDPIDMDEDEKEMLSEARARLANTQGKKAKRKARERQLEEARRLAVLQKKRELKAAGIIMRSKTKRKGMDYNADIPFEKKPAAGFYDTSDEQARIEAAPVGQTLRRLENKRKPDEEEAERKKRQKRGKEGDTAHQTKFLAARDAQIQKLKEAESISRRSRLMLPPAQVGEAELEEIVKIGRAGENAKELVGGVDDPTGQLLGDYDSLERAKMARTPRTAPQQDNIMMEARNLRNMTMAQTPLLGDENTPLHVSENGGTGFEGATPRHQVAFTPNPLATPLHGGNGVPSTPREGVNGSVSGTPLRTPMRDNLSINPETGASFIGDTPRDQRLRTSSVKRSLKAGFMNLPRPENNFELLVPDDEEEDAVEGQVLSEEDAAERDARLKRIREEEERLELARRSQVVQFGLPRPPNVDLQALVEDLRAVPATESELEKAQRLVDLEVAQLLQHDSIAHPIPGTSNPGSTQSLYEIPPDDYVAFAKSEIQRELAGALGFPDAPAEQVKTGIIGLSKEDVFDETSTWAYVRSNLAYDASARAWKDPAEMDLDARIAGYSALLEDCRARMAREASRAAKVEKKLGVTLGGYMNRAQDFAKRMTDAYGAMQEVTVDLESFSRLRVTENAAGPMRVSALREEVDKLEGRERSLQSLYAELEKEKKDAEERVAALEERAMLEAEMLNEAALNMESVEATAS